MALSFDDESRALGKPVRDHLGKQLRDFYHDLIGDSLPTDLTRLVRRLERALQDRNEAPNPAFMADLLEAVPRLRAFAMSLTYNMDQAEDLVQETILKAWGKQASFQAGTNLHAWLFTILRNRLYTEYRKRVREVEDIGGSHAATLIALPEQFDRVELQDIAGALDKLRPDQREALLMVSVQGMSYEDAAAVIGIPPGTVKSRVNRGRTRLAELLGLNVADAGGNRLSQE
jgi:RNA polymerase sigma-70 factor (ECF subfamily)